MLSPYFTRPLNRSNAGCVRLCDMLFALVWLRVILPYVGAVAISVSIVLLLWIVPKRQTDHLVGVTDKERFDSENDARTTLAQIVGGVFVLIGLFATWYTVKISQRTLGISQDNLKVAQDMTRVAQESQFTDRFTKAMSELGDKQIDVRVGGIYALERIARESSSEERGAIVGILTAFVRTHAPITRETGHIDCESSTSILPISRNGKPIGFRTLNRTSRKLWPPRDVRTVLEILGHGVITDQVTVVLSDTDLECAYLGGYNLKGAEMQRTHLEDAWIVGAHLDGASLQGAVGTNALFNRTSFRNADMRGANLEHSKNIDCAKLAEAKYFMGAHLPRGCEAAIAKQAQEEAEALNEVK
jgi:hypothetical protein